MFFRTKTSGSRSYLQIVENRWEEVEDFALALAGIGLRLGCPVCAVFLC
jgi:predicted DNA-binding protein